MAITGYVACVTYIVKPLRLNICLAYTNYRPQKTLLIMEEAV